MLKMSAPPGRHSGNHDRSAKTRRQLAMTQDWQAVNKARTGRRRPRWQYFTLTLALAGTAAGVAFSLSPSRSASPEAARLGDGILSNSDLTGLLGQGEISSAQALPAPLVTATASAQPTKAKAKAKHKPGPVPTISPSAPVSTSPSSGMGSSTPLGGANYAGSLVLSQSGSQLTSWNQTSSYCPQESWQVPNGTVGTDSSGNATLSVNGQTGSCVALVSPATYSSAVIEADIDFPALPGSSDTIANWTSFWLTDGANWPQDGELDAVEAEPVTGVNATAWHSGTNGNEFSASTDDFFDTKLPKNTGNLTPGWHTVDIVYSQGFMAVYYDGHEWTSYQSSNVTGDPLNIYITTSVTADNSQVDGTIGGSPKNSDSSPATVGVKYLKVWSFK
jgi:hypothetical protein